MACLGKCTPHFCHFCFHRHFESVIDLIGLEKSQEYKAELL